MAQMGTTDMISTNSMLADFLRRLVVNSLTPDASQSLLAKFPKEITSEFV
jgi:hypothetical protein